MTTMPQMEPLEDWFENNKPHGWEDWEWNKFLVSIARIYLISACATLKLPMPELLKHLSVPLPGEFDS